MFPVELGKPILLDPETEPETRYWSVMKRWVAVSIYPI